MVNATDPPHAFGVNTHFDEFLADHPNNCPNLPDLAWNYPQGVDYLRTWQVADDGASGENALEL